MNRKEIRLDESLRLKTLPPYLFAEIDRIVEKERNRGRNLINLGIGDPDLPTPPHIVEEMSRCILKPENHRYPSYEGLPEFREAVANWYQRRFGVELNPENEVLILIGSKEGIGHLPLALVNPGDMVLIPDPAYPVYVGGTLLAGGIPYRIPLSQANDFLPELESIPSSILSRAKILYLNYPNNPTCGVASLDFFNQVVEFAYKANVFICHDAAYTEVAFDDYRAPSFLQADGAKEVGVEFHSLSKTYNMTGWRIGFVVGNKEVLHKLKKVKSNLDSGVFRAIQYAGMAALNGSEACVEEMKKIYKERRDVLCDGLRKLGWEISKPKATFYLWIPIPEGYTSASFVSTIIQKAGVITTPGVGFGEHGEGYIRVALTVDKEKLEEVVERMREIEFKAK